MGSMVVSVMPSVYIACKQEDKLHSTVIKECYLNTKFKETKVTGVSFNN